MTAAESGFLLLTSHLGDPNRKVLTPQQMRELTKAVSNFRDFQMDKELTSRDLATLGLPLGLCEQVTQLLSQYRLLEKYLERGRKQGCIPITRADSRYPACVRRRLGGEAPGCLWAKGNLDILDMQAVSLVGNRDLLPENAQFAAQVGREAARQGVALISGNARGADSAGQNAALAAGGKIISVVADCLQLQSSGDNALYLSEEEFDAPFSSVRALKRNRVIHALGKVCFVAQCSQERGGTWDGTIRNLKGDWTPVYVFDDGSAAAAKLVDYGASYIRPEELRDFSKLAVPTPNFLNGTI